MGIAWAWDGEGWHGLARMLRRVRADACVTIHPPMHRGGQGDSYIQLDVGAWVDDDCPIDAREPCPPHTGYTQATIHQGRWTWKTGQMVSDAGEADAQGFIPS